MTRLKRAVSDTAPPTPASFAHDNYRLSKNDLTLGRELGSGQFGVVKEGLFKNITRVAVKMMKVGSMSEDDFVAEAQVSREKAATFDQNFHARHSLARSYATSDIRLFSPASPSPLCCSATSCR